MASPARKFGLFVSNNRRPILFGAVVGVLLVFSVSIIRGSNLVVRSYDSGATLSANGDFGFFKDASAYTSLSRIDFGKISIGHNYEMVYVKNLGNVNITLNIQIIAKNSSINSVVLTDSYGGSVISVGGVIPIQFDLFAQGSAPPGSYYFTVNVYSL